MPYTDEQYGVIFSCISRTGIKMQLTKNKSNYSRKQFYGIILLFVIGQTHYVACW
jgi:hypothetical protein